MAGIPPLPVVAPAAQLDSMLRLVARFAALRLADSMPILRACALVRGFFRRARSADPSEISIPQFGQ